MKKVTMYSGDPCPYCRAAKALLKSKNVEIEEFDIFYYLLYLICLLYTSPSPRD